MTPAKPPTAEEVKRCPWCGNPGTRDPRHSFHTAGPFMHVQCGACSAMGPAVRPHDEAQAIVAWNALASPREASAEPAISDDMVRVAMDAYHNGPHRDGAASMRLALKAALVLYSGPAQPREPLTPERIVEIRDSMLPSQGEPFDCIAFARAIEREHRIGEQENSHG